MVVWRDGLIKETHTYETCDDVFPSRRGLRAWRKRFKGQWRDPGWISWWNTRDNMVTRSHPTRDILELYREIKGWRIRGINGLDWSHRRDEIFKINHLEWTKKSLWISKHIYILCKNDRWKRTVVNFKLTTFNSNNNNINSIVQRESYLYPK